MLTRVTCPDDPHLVHDEPMCVSVISKNVRGELSFVEDPRREECEQRGCWTLKTVHRLDLNVHANADCEADEPVLIRAGKLVSPDLSSAFMNADGTLRGFHAGSFRWTTPDLVIGGTLSGIANAGTHRVPLDPACQDCYAPGAWEGRFCGLVRRTRNPSLRRCNVLGIYKLQLEGPSEDGGLGGVIGVMEGVIVCSCDQ
jgi:hypothetical protein